MPFWVETLMVCILHKPSDNLRAKKNISDLHHVRYFCAQKQRKDKYYNALYDAICLQKKIPLRKEIRLL